MDGRGLFFFSNGDTYDGIYCLDKFDGEGTFTWAVGKYAGDRYAGGWQECMRNGRGVYTFANGDKWEGLYRNDKRVDAAGTFYQKKAM